MNINKLLCKYICFPIEEIDFIITCRKWMEETEIKGQYIVNNIVLI